MAALIALYRHHELPAHLRRALANGVTREELAEIAHEAFYAGWPAAATAADVTRRTLTGDPAEDQEA